MAKSFVQLESSLSFRLLDFENRLGRTCTCDGERELFKGEKQTKSFVRVSAVLCVASCFILAGARLIEAPNIPCSSCLCAHCLDRHHRSPSKEHLPRLL